MVLKYAVVDWESGIYEHLKPLLARLPPSHPFKNNKDLAIKAYNDIEFSIRCDYSNPTYSYAARLSKAYLNLASSLSLPPPPQSEADAISASIPKWPAFPDTVAALHRLKKHYKIVVLFNIGYEIFKHLLDDALGGVEFDALYMNEDIVADRPDLYNLERPLQDIQRVGWALLRQVLYTAHVIELDDESEEEMPLGIVWIDRGKKTGKEDTMEKVGDEVAYTWRFEDLKGMADAVDEEFGLAGKIVSEVDRGIER